MGPSIKYVTLFEGGGGLGICDMCDRGGAIDAGTSRKISWSAPNVIMAGDKPHVLNS